MVECTHGSIVHLIHVHYVCSPSPSRYVGDDVVLFYHVHSSIKSRIFLVHDNRTRWRESVWFICLLDKFDLCLKANKQVKYMYLISSGTLVVALIICYCFCWVCKSQELCFYINKSLFEDITYTYDFLLHILSFLWCKIVVELHSSALKHNLS